MNNKRIVTIILALCLIGFFFLPYFSTGDLLSGMSGFEWVTAPGGNSGDVEMIIMKYIFILIPLSGIMLIIGAINNGHYFLGRGLWALLPLLTFIYFICRMLIGNGGQDSIEISEMVKMFGAGFWATLGVSLVLAFYWPKGNK